jgi:hypothetical protein
LGGSAGAGGRRRLAIALSAGPYCEPPRTGPGGLARSLLELRAVVRLVSGQGADQPRSVHRVETPGHDYIAPSNFGATSFLRLITPGSSIWLSCARVPNVRATPATSPATSRSVPLVRTSVTISA